MSDAFRIWTQVKLDQIWVKTADINLIMTWSEKAEVLEWDCIKLHQNAAVILNAPASDKLLHTCTHMCTKLSRSHQLSQSVLDCPGLRWTGRPHIHTSALYCSFHCGNGKSQCGTEGEEMVAKACGPCEGPCMVGISLLTHTLTHVHYCTQRGFLCLSGSETSKPHRSENPQRPCIPSNCRKSWTCPAHLEKCLRFSRGWDHLILE